jgi:hypothetical protein
MPLLFQTALLISKRMQVTTSPILVFLLSIREVQYKQPDCSDNERSGAISAKTTSACGLL